MERSRIPHINRLKKYRRWVGLSQKQVAKRLGLKNTSPLSRWEQGLAYPSIVNVFRLSRIYKTIPQELYTELYQKITHDITMYENNQMVDIETLNS